MEWQEWLEFLEYILPGAFGPELSINYGNIFLVFELFGFDRDEKVTALWLLNKYLVHYKNRRIEQQKMEAKAVSRRMPTKR